MSEEANASVRDATTVAHSTARRESTASTLRLLTLAAFVLNAGHAYSDSPSSGAQQTLTGDAYDAPGLL